MNIKSFIVILFFLTLMAGNTWAATVTVLQSNPAKISAFNGQSFPITYNFSGGPTSVSAQVFVHFKNIAGDIAFQGDFQPQTPTTSWKGSMSFPKTVAVPLNLAAGTYAIVLGLYDGNNKLTLNPGTGVIDEGAGVGYQVGTVTVSEQPITVLQSTPANISAFNSQKFDIKYNFSGGPTLVSDEIFVHFKDAAGNIAFQGDFQPSPPTTGWDGTVIFSKQLTLPSNMPAGTYSTVLGLYSGKNQETLIPGPGVKNLGSTVGYQVGTLIVSEQPVTIFMATPSAAAVTPGQILDLKYHFSGGPELNDWTVFIHILDSSGNLVFQADHTPPIPTTLWTGADYSYFRTITIPTYLSEGIYSITAGLYVGSSTRKTLYLGAGVQDLTKQAYKIGTFTVASANGATVSSASSTSSKIEDSKANAWTLSSGVVMENGKPAGHTKNVILVLYNNGTLYSENKDDLWWSWNGNTWVPVLGDPRNLNLLTTPASTIPPQMKPLFTCVSIHSITDTKILDIAKSAGFPCVRMDLRWEFVEKSPGSYDFTSYDTFVANLESRGLKLLMTLDYGNTLYSTGIDNYPPITPTAVAAWGKFVGAAAKHFKSNTTIMYEIWNEENGPQFWGNAPNASQYIPVLNLALAQIRANNPKAQITSGGLSQVDLTYLGQFFSSSNIKIQGQAVGFHPYRYTAPETAITDLQNAQTILGAFPFWITEWGYSSAWYNNANDGQTSAARAWQARMAIRQILTEWMSGSPIDVYYDIKDDDLDYANFEDNFGLVDTNYADKPAMTAVRTMNAQLSGRTFAGVVSTGSATLQVLRENLSTNSKDSLYVIWLNTLGSSSSIILPLNATAVDMSGNPIKLTGNSKELTYSLTEVDGPIYVHIP